MFTSLHRENSQSMVSSIEICKYSDNSYIEILDPRNGILKNHAFSARGVFILNKVKIEPIHGNLYSDNGALIKEGASWDPLTAYISFPFNAKPFKYVDFEKRVLYLRSSSFWHWVLEDLPPFLFLIRNFPDLPVVVSKDRAPYVADLLTLLNLEVIEIENSTSYSELVLVEFGTDSGWPTPSDIRILNEEQLFPLNNTPSRLIYISRRHSTRSPSNEVEIEAVFNSRGFEIVNLEDLNLLEKIQLFRDSLILAGIHGAGLVGMVWMQKGSMVLDIANENYWTESAFKLAHMMNHEYKAHIYSGPIYQLVDVNQMLSDFGL